VSGSFPQSPNFARHACVRQRQQVSLCRVRSSSSNIARRSVRVAAMRTQTERNREVELVIARAIEYVGP
jgi:hypothetical protein